MSVQETRERPRVLEAAGKDKLLPALKEASRVLELITKGLTDYLELKRLAFPRLYFLRQVVRGEALTGVCDHARAGTRSAASLGAQTQPADPPEHPPH